MAKYARLELMAEYDSRDSFLQQSLCGCISTKEDIIFL